MSNRCANIDRNTSETKIKLSLDLDGIGESHIQTGVGFLDHMLTLFAKHSLCNLRVECLGDTHIDDHHSTEDIGIALGQAFTKSLGDKSGIRRYGCMTLPMDETLVTSAIDFSGRSYLVYKTAFSSPKIGSFDTELVEEFWQGFASNAKCNLHIVLHHGHNSHHIAEAIFKSVARSIRAAIEIDPRQVGVPSTKGVL